MLILFIKLLIVCFFIIWLNGSTIKRRILIGSRSGPNFAIQTAKMDRSRIGFAVFSIQCTGENNFLLGGTIPSSLEDSFS